jgi:hypothetical protein
VFYVNVPAGILAVLVVALYLPFVHPGARRGEIDELGTAMIAALSPILIGPSIAGNHPWRSRTVIVPIACGLAGMILFFWVERSRREPTLPA